MSKRLVSGIKPTGQLHIGNYLGAIKQWVELQDDYDCFFFVADYHALTTRPKPEELKEQTLQVAAMLIALGLDPKACTLFLQSDVPEHTELSWILSNFTTVGALSRMTQFKEKTSQQGENAGLFTYPILMSADVVIYDAEVVPVGDDQVQHLELTREIVRSFNHHAGQTLVEPKPLLTKAARVMAMNNPAQKMSKSVDGSAIGLLDSDQTIEQTIKRAVTDSDANCAKMSPGVANLFLLLESFSQPETVRHFEKIYKNHQLKYSELKEQLIEDVIEFLKPVQKTYHSLMANEKHLLDILNQGQAKARPIAQETLARVRKKLGLLT